jgi:hypothetical protein
MDALRARLRQGQKEKMASQKVDVDLARLSNNI